MLRQLCSQPNDKLWLKALDFKPVKRVSDIAQAKLGYVRVKLRCFAAAVPRQMLDIAQVGALLQQMCGKTVAQCVGSNRPA
jgi:hypothetical protein